MAPRPDLITEDGWALIRQLPPVLQDDPDYRSAMHCYAKETERVEVSVDWLRQELNPLTAVGPGLPMHEALLRLPAAPGLTPEQRRQRNVSRLRSFNADPSERSWVERISARIGSNWAYAKKGTDASVAAFTIRITLPYASGSDSWNEALRIIREDTPSEYALTFVSGTGFRLDVSQMDVEGMGV